MEYYGIKNIEGKAVINEVKRKKKRSRPNILNLVGYSLAVLNLVAYTLIAAKLL